MTNSSVFFGNKGITLTSTSANHVANLAKEFVKHQTKELESLSFSDKVATAFGTDTKMVLKKGADQRSLEDIPQKLSEIGEAYALIAWLREGIKVKNQQLEEVEHLDLDGYYKLTGKEKPSFISKEEFLESKGIKEPGEEPEEEAKLTTNELEGSLPEKEQIENNIRNRQQFILNRIISILEDKTSELKDITSNPENKTGDYVIRYTPTVGTADIEALQQTLDKQLAEINTANLQYQVKLDEAERKDKAEKEQAYTDALCEYNRKSEAYEYALEEYNYQEKSNKTQYTQDRASLEAYKIIRSKEIGELKIVIPAALQGIYSKVTSKK